MCPIMTDLSSIIVGSVGLGLVVATTVPAAYANVRKFVPRKQGAEYHAVDALYQDGDGVATEKSQEEFSTLIPRCLALAGCLAGLGLSGAVAALATIRPENALLFEGWLAFASWVCEIWSC